MELIKDIATVVGYGIGGLFALIIFLSPFAFLFWIKELLDDQREAIYRFNQTAETFTKFLNDVMEQKRKEEESNQAD